MTNKMMLIFTLPFLFSTQVVVAEDHSVVQIIKRNAANFAIDGNKDGANAQDVYLYSEDDSNVNQQWNEIDRGDGYYSYQKVDTDFCLDGNKGGDNAQNIYLWSCSENNYNQHWLKVDMDDGYYRLEKRNAAGYSIDGNNGGENEQSIYLWASNDSNPNQHWLFNYIDDDTNDTGNCDISWSAPTIAINQETIDLTLENVDIACANEATISMNVEGVGPMENADYINIYYRVDGSTPKTMLSKTNAFGQMTASASGISGERVEIIIEGYTSYADETYTISNIQITESDDTSNGGGTSTGEHTYVGGGGTVAGALPVSCDTPEGFTLVNSLSAMISAMNKSNVKVALAPGTYSIDESDTGLFTSQSLPGGSNTNTLLPVNGSNSHYDFRCTKIDFDTDLWREFGSDGATQLRTVGNYNTISNLVIEDIGETSPIKGALGVMMDGRDNVIEGLVVTTRGAQPYGLGDAYGKGGGPILSHQKHSSVLLRGLRNTFRQSTVYNYSYGHSVFMQGSEETLIDGIYVQGELRSTADMLAANDPRFAAADERAASVDFGTVWGYTLPTGYWMSLQEAGIRAYNGGNTIIDGVEYTRGAGSVTVLNSVVRNTRTGVVLTHASGDKYIENTTVLGCETGFAVGSGNIVNSYGNADVGPVLSFDYSSDQGTTAEITVLATDGSKNGWGAVAFIGGKNHNITLRSDQANVNQNLQVVVSGDKHSIRHLEDALQNQDQLTASYIEINNLTNFPMLINDKASNVSGQSDGPISGQTSGNNIQQN